MSNLEKNTNTNEYIESSSEESPEFLQTYSNGIEFFQIPNNHLSNILANLALGGTTESE